MGMKQCKSVHWKACFDVIWILLIDDIIMCILVTPMLPELILSHLLTDLKYLGNEW